MTEARAATLLDLIEAESKLPESQFKGIANLNRPFTRQEQALGAELFDGRRPLANGAPACISCHTVPAVGGLGGGRLGPDLSGVYANVQGPTALAGWLSAPPSPTMQPVFTAQRRLKSAEVIALVAFIDQAARSARPAGTAGTVVFLMLALLGAVAALMALDAVWRRRFHAVRRTLVEQTADAFNTRKRGRS
jgi:mono/diheme cytochrome c family protein